MTDVAERMTKIERSVAQAVEALRTDAGASPVLAAVVGELEKKLGKAREAISGGDAAAIREAVVEVEQAADSANVAAEVDSGATDETRAAITAAHDRICLLKSEM